MPGEPIPIVKMVRRRDAPVQEESSSDEEDAFAKLSKKGKKDKKGAGASNQGLGGSSSKSPDSWPTAQLPASTTSSMKRHHVANNDMRKAKMDALILELEAEKSKKPIKTQDRGRGFVPEKKGSFVDPEDEHITTNIFVGNLAPSITEEELTDLFRQFGDLYSVKIMWPRTPEERSRNRNTGFVCFMTREDAEDAMQCDETDPFNVGRRIMMRWGKNVKKIIKRGTGGVAIAPIRKRAATSSQAPGDQEAKRQRTESSGSRSSKDTTGAASNPFATIPTYNHDKHGKHSVHVEVPRPPARAHFISTVASFVAKDGDALERKLLQLEGHNSDFAFLAMPSATKLTDAKLEESRKKRAAEHIFYRWRVYAFCQGDGYNVWRTEPFMMIRPNGNWWMPPAVNQEAARQEEQDRKMREEDIERQKKERRRHTTGRQLEQARRRGLAGSLDGGAQLTHEEADQFSLLVRKRLCASRESICEAMAFCFEKSGAAKQIGRMLKERLLDDGISSPGISVETRIARLFLLSDVLFNSQQPGVKNAFLYRDAVERMAPDVFTSFGKHGGGTLGRMTKNKLSTAVSAVLGAWTNWSVFDPIFLDELHARYEGREIKKVETNDDKGKGETEKAPKEEDVNANAVKVITEKQRQNWMEVCNEEVKALPTSVEEEKEVEDDNDNEAKQGHVAVDVSESSNLDGEPLNEDESDTDGELLEESDIDGEPLRESDLDGMSIEESDIDGEPLVESDLD